MSTLQPDLSGLPPLGLPSAPEDPAAWAAWRRGRLDAFESLVYGRFPRAEPVLRVELLEERPSDSGGGMLRRRSRATLSHDGRELAFELLAWLPSGRGPFPFAVGLNFLGNAACTRDPDVPLDELWYGDSEADGVRGNRPTEASRGRRVGRWPAALLAGRGWGVATVSHAAFAPDDPARFLDRAAAFLGLGGEGDDRCGALGLWAWGLVQARRALLAWPEVSARSVFAIGHSRLGKAALWAAAQDEDFAGVFSNGSGCCGASLARRRRGERLADLHRRFPHWCAPAHRRFDDREDDRPLDQHHLLALAAPRFLHVGSASGDAWADPEGERAAVAAANPAWEAHGGPAWPADAPWREHACVGHGAAGHGLRPGAHDLTAEDWRLFLDRATRHLAWRARRRPGPR